jgi:hypothetical protein
VVSDIPAVPKLKGQMAARPLFISRGIMNLFSAEIPAEADFIHDMAAGLFITAQRSGDATPVPPKAVLLAPRVDLSPKGYTTHGTRSPQMPSMIMFFIWIFLFNQPECEKVIQHGFIFFTFCTFGEFY